MHTAIDHLRRRLPLPVALLACALFVATPTRAETEPQKVVRLTRLLEQAPLDPQAPEHRRWVLKWVESTPDLQVTVCQLLGSLPSQPHRYRAELVGQMIFANAAFQIEHPAQRADFVRVQTAGVEGVLRLYRTLLERHGAERSDHLDLLLEKQRSGDFAAYMRQQVQQGCGGGKRA